MTSILSSQRTPWDLLGRDTGRALQSILPQAVQAGYNREQQNRQMQQQKQSIASQYGPEIANLPEYLQKIVIAKQHEAENYKKQYEAKTNSQLELMKKLGLADLFQGQGQGQGGGENQENVPMEEVPHETSGEIPVKLDRMIPEDKINAMALINPAVADKMQKHNDNLMSEKRHVEDLSFRKESARDKALTSSFKENEPYINKTFDQYEDSLRKEAIMDRMDQLENAGELSSSGIVNFLERVGFQPEWLQNPSNEEYTKLGLDLLGGGTLQADYGSRVLNSEFKVSMQRIPTLSQTPEGRKQIKENLKTMLLPSRLKQERLQHYLDKSERTGEPLPHNLRGKILQDIKPDLEDAYDKFKQRNGRYKVKDGTAPTDDIIEKYYFMADGNEDKIIKMMEEDGYALD